jgi:hypothetical protein
MLLLQADDIAALVMQPISLTAFDNKSNVNVARNQYDPTGNPWFGKSLNSVDYPDWGHPHQVTNFNAISCLPCNPRLAEVPHSALESPVCKKMLKLPPEAACTYKTMLAHVH